MQEVKNKGNSIRSLLDEKSLDSWHRLTAFTNQTKDVVKNLRQFVSPEMCTGAWAKMYEILDGFQLFGDPSVHRDGMNEFSSFHVCEVNIRVYNCFI